MTARACIKSALYWLGQVPKYHDEDPVEINASLAAGYAEDALSVIDGDPEGPAVYETGD